MTTRYPKLYDGEELAINPQKQVLNSACCDCYLVHNIEFIVGHRQKLTIRMWRDRRKTAALRRERL